MHHRIHPDRIRNLNHRPERDGAYVLYHMQQSQRAEDNPALNLAVFEANRRTLPVLVSFGLFAGYPEANLRHFRFLAEGLAEVRRTLAGMGIRFALRIGSPDEVAVAMAKKAALVVCDMGYLRHQRRWRDTIAASVSCPVIQVEADAVVPVETASCKAEYMARTLRPKLHRRMDEFLEPEPDVPLPRIPSLHMQVPCLDFETAEDLLAHIRCDLSIPPVSRHFTGGTTEGKQRFDTFVSQRLRHYAAHSNQPQTPDVSHMGPYLHFGQVSPVYLARIIRSLLPVEPENAAAFLEQLVVRRELSINFVYYTPDYDAFTCLPAWAGQTLRDHAADTRPYLYDIPALESANTHDPYWNAAMTQMTATGYMHNYMRMYWGKKILEWSALPEDAFRSILILNNRYFLDGRDPNSYAGVAWIFGMHDRAWKERAVFGKVRCMTAAGLKRKCDIGAYIRSQGL